jgi:hypothetical protein
MNIFWALKYQSHLNSYPNYESFLIFQQNGNPEDYFLALHVGVFNPFCMSLKAMAVFYNLSF